MTLDPQTLIVAAAAAIAAAALLFGLTTLQRHDDTPNRLAAGSLLASFVGAISAPAVGDFGVDRAAASVTAQSTALVVMTLGLGAGAGALWAAAQGFAGRVPTVRLAGLVVVVAGAAAWGVDQISPEWALGPACVVVTAGYALAAVELRRAPMAFNLNSVVLEFALWCAAAVSLVLGVGAGTGGLARAQAWAGLTAMVAVIAILAGMALMALRVERYGNWWTLGEARDRAELGVHEDESLLKEARDRIERCRHVGQPVHVITTALPGLNELNLAYGHLAGDAALRWVAALLRRQAPPSAVLGHLGAGHFIIVTSREPELVANAVQNGMMRVPPPATLPVRLTPVFAWASSSEEAGYNFDQLRIAAEERLTLVV